MVCGPSESDSSSLPLVDVAVVVIGVRVAVLSVELDALPLDCIRLAYFFLVSQATPIPLRGKGLVRLRYRTGDNAKILA